MIVSITVSDKTWRKMKGLRPLTRRALATAMRLEAGVRATAEVSVLFAGDEEVASINRTWRGKAKPTNVLSFPCAAPAAQNGGRFLGDIVLAKGVVTREAAEQGKSLEDHVTHLLVHAMMHLLGHDHENEQEAEIMEAREAAVLEALGIVNPYEPRDAL